MVAYRIQDEISWHDIPSPIPGDPRKLSVTIEPVFWQRLIRHVELRPATWNACLGHEVVESLVALGRRPVRATDLLPGELPGKLHDILLAGLKGGRMLVQDFTGDGGPGGEGKSPATAMPLTSWRVIRDDVTLVVNWYGAAGRLIDCFNTGGLNRPAHESVCNRTWDTRLRAMIREADFDPASNRFLLPDPAEPATSLAFLDPTAWGFTTASDAVTYSWQCPDPAAAASTADPRTKSSRPSVPSPAAQSPCDPLCLVSLLECARRGVENATDPTWLNSEAGLDACFEMARIAGLCHLTGARPEARMTPTVARGACLALQRWLHDLAAHASLCAARATDQTLAWRREISLSLAETRLVAWAAFVAIDQSIPHELSAAEAAPTSDALDAALEAMASFDEALERTRSLWEPWVVSSRLRLNWKQLLKPEYATPMPWWLASDEDEDAALPEAANQE